MERAPVDTTGPVEIAERVWWVGHRQEGDPFQCHVYLLEQGDQSVLIDPGSRLTFSHTLRKVEQVLPFSQIRYFVCQHQDPDIAAAMPLIDEMTAREDALLVTHWRAWMLLRHYGLKMRFWLIDQNAWQLQLSDRLLRFVFTPYAHFPGAFCTFDTKSQVLFSSDLFGGLTEQFALFAQDERHFEALRPFHEHYIPSRDILEYALSRIAEHPVRMIAPQHGSIIPEPLVDYMTRKLRQLDCGLYLLAGESTDIQRLSRLNRILRDITQTMIIYRDFRDIASRLCDIARAVLPAESLEFYARLETGEVLWLSAGSRYRGVVREPPASVTSVLGMDHAQWLATHQAPFAPLAGNGSGELVGPGLLIPLFSPNRGTAQALAILRLNEPVAPSGEMRQVIEQMTLPLQVAVEREALYRAMELEHQRFYERSIRDPLTGLFTRLYMQDMVQRLFDIHDRDANSGVAVAMIDIDNFKGINDRHGHNQGDEVLRRSAAVLKDMVRRSDLPVRLGGEEFAVFLVGESASDVEAFAERLRQGIAALTFAPPMTGEGATVSIGTAVRRQGESLTDFIQRADVALYEAKRGGRNRVCNAA